MTDSTSGTGSGGWKVEAAAGGALGLFVGALLGLSVTPGTTTAVVGGLVALLAAFFGLVISEKMGAVQPANSRIIAFCLFALGATIAGVYVRSHDLLGPSLLPVPGPLEAFHDDLKRAGFSDEKEIKDVIKAYVSKDSNSKLPDFIDGYRKTTFTQPPGAGVFKPGTGVLKQEVGE